MAFKEKAFKENEVLAIAHFGELWLKGHNRNEYISRLIKNVNAQLANESYNLERDYDRLVIRFTEDSDVASITAKLGRTFGLSGHEISTTTAPDVAKIAAAARKLLKARTGAKVVKISSHRSDKTLPFDSNDIIRRVKKDIEKLGLEADTKGFDTEIGISVKRNVAFVSIERARGPGGLPVGASGKGVVLMSGGIDSPVAAWYAMKRGVVPVYVHIHGFQDAKEAESGKVADLVKTLSGYYPHYRLYLVPSHIFQAGSFKFGKYELILLKAFMLKLAERVARKEKARLIFTGESLGQVASQTPGNLYAAQQGTRTPILRPLIGCDKEEIIKTARKIGTYEDSIRPYKDVCSINAKSPTLSADPKKVKEMLSQMDVNRIVTRSLKLARIVDA
ncbi:tRNA sulfurtransferase [uncultured archaeon]|nr:tRNA sulfurtransferase [uncultured archaeon]